MRLENVEHSLFSVTSSCKVSTTYTHFHAPVRGGSEFNCNETKCALKSRFLFQKNNKPYACILSSNDEAESVQ